MPSQSVSHSKSCVGHPCVPAIPNIPKCGVRHLMRVFATALWMAFLQWMLQCDKSWAVWTFLVQSVFHNCAQLFWGQDVPLVDFLFSEQILVQAM